MHTDLYNACRLMKVFGHTILLVTYPYYTHYTIENFHDHIACVIRKILKFH